MDAIGKIAKLIEKDQNYYRFDLQTGNIVYFGHSINVKEDEYITLTIKDIVKKIDEIVEIMNTVSVLTLSTNDSLPQIGETLGMLSNSVLELQQAGKPGKETPNE